MKNGQPKYEFLQLCLLASLNRLRSRICLYLEYDSVNSSLFSINSSGGGRSWKPSSRNKIKITEVNIGVIVLR